MANFLGVTRQTIIAIENNKYNPTLELAIKIVKFLKASVEDVFKLEDEKEYLSMTYCVYNHFSPINLLAILQLEIMITK